MYIPNRNIHWKFWKNFLLILLWFKNLDYITWNTQFLDIDMIKYPLYNLLYQSFLYVIIYLTPTHLFQCKFFHYGYFTLILCPLLTKLRADLHPILVSLIKCFILGSKRVDLEAPFSISSSSEVDGDSNNQQVISVIILFYQPSFNKNLSRNLIWHLFYLSVGKLVVISISDTNYFITLYFIKYSSIR